MRVGRFSRWTTPFLPARNSIGIETPPHHHSTTCRVTCQLTLQLLVQSAPGCNAQSADELFELDCAALIFIKDVEDVVGELGRVAEREELAIDLLELCHERVSGDKGGRSMSAKAVGLMIQSQWGKLE